MPENDKAIGFRHATGFTQLLWIETKETRQALFLILARLII